VNETGTWQLPGHRVDISTGTSLKVCKETYAHSHPLSSSVGWVGGWGCEMTFLPNVSTSTRTKARDRAQLLRAVGAMSIHSLIQLKKLTSMPLFG
jgi:hypothetical protein